MQICKEAYDAKFGENVDFVERTKRVIKEFGKEVATPDATCQGLFNKNHLFSSDFLRNSLNIILFSLSCIVSLLLSLKWTITS